MVSFGTHLSTFDSAFRWIYKMQIIFTIQWVLNFCLDHTHTHTPQLCTTFRFIHSLQIKRWHSIYKTLARTQNVIRTICFLLLSSVAIQQLVLQSAHNAIKSILSKAYMIWSLGHFSQTAVTTVRGSRFGIRTFGDFSIFGSLKLT